MIDFTAFFYFVSLGRDLCFFCMNMDCMDFSFKKAIKWTATHTVHSSEWYATQILLETQQHTPTNRTAVEKCCAHTHTQSVLWLSHSELCYCEQGSHTGSIRPRSENSCVCVRITESNGCLHNLDAWQSYCTISATWQPNTSLPPLCV
jgi:hypothetical protein